MSQVFPYRSVHEYLDEVLAGLAKEPTQEEIRACKKEYWRRYNTHLKKKRRRELKYVSLSFSKAEYEQLQEKAQQVGMSIYRLIKSQTLDTAAGIPLGWEVFQQLLFDLLNQIEDMEGGFISQEEFIRVHLQKLKVAITQLEEALNQLSHDH